MSTFISSYPPGTILKVGAGYPSDQAARVMVTKQEEGWTTVIVICPGPKDGAFGGPPGTPVRLVASATAWVLA